MQGPASIGFMQELCKWASFCVQWENRKKAREASGIGVATVDDEKEKRKGTAWRKTGVLAGVVSYTGCKSVP